MSQNYKEQTGCSIIFPTSGVDVTINFLLLKLYQYLENFD